MALLLALLFIVLLTVLVVEFAYENQVESSFVDVRSAQFEAEVAARSAVAAGMGLLAADANLASYGQQPLPGRGSAPVDDALAGMSECDSLMDAWALGVPYRQINKAAMQCTVSDEYGKINLNALLVASDMYRGDDGATTPWGNGQPPVNQYGDDSESMVPEIENRVLVEALRSLFMARGAETDPVDGILDWLDSNDDSRPDGAENDVYGTLEVPYATKNAPLDSVEELLMIRGVTPEVFFGNPDNDELPLTELLTVRGDRRGRINLNTAPPEVLLAVGEALGQPGLAEKVLEERELNPITDQQDAESRGLIDPTTAGNNPNKPPDENPAVGPNGQPIPDGESLEQDPFVFSSRVFRIRGNGESGEVAVRVEAYVQRDAGMGMMNDDPSAPDGRPVPGGTNPRGPGNTGGTGAGTDDDALLGSAPSMFRILDWRIER